MVQIPPNLLNFRTILDRKRCVNKSLYLTDKERHKYSS